ncbi:MAG: NAD/NADP octopine/nopaline dehydrogenase family protein [Bacillota bacterium]|nr:NAD/NADP octopine/nopaline dehydrogenase family protein [Bacillota bacterium]
MKITILGTGNAGTAMAADLTHKGHTVNLLKTSSSKNENVDYLINNHNEVLVEDLDQTYKSRLNMVTRDFDQALKEKQDIVVVFIQTKYHENVIKKLVNYLDDGQIIYILPGYLSTAYVKKHSKKDLIVVEGESSPIDCRLVEPGHVKVLFKNIRNPIGIYPASKKHQVFKTMEAMAYNFTLLNSVVEAALHNPNLIVHTIGAIMSIPRIEYSQGKYSMYKEVFTPTVMNLVKALDKEKMDILEKLGLERLAYVDACKFRNCQDLDQDSYEVFFDYAENSSPKGPFIAPNRYVMEDVPEGLVLMEALAKLLKIESPVTTGLIDIAGACMEMDFRATGRTLEKLDLKDLQSLYLYAQA